MYSSWRIFLMLVCCSVCGKANIFSQSRDSVGFQTVPRFSVKQLYAPGALIISGIVLSGNGQSSIKNEIVNARNRNIPNFRTTADNYLQFAPIALTYGFELAGMRPKTDIHNRSIILLKAEIVMEVAVTILKHATHVLRPDSSAYNSFPSEHTAQAFAGAVLLSEEFGYKYKWVPYVSYGIASSVGILRMANNKHYISDVLVGAGIGILSTKIAYWTHAYKWQIHKRNIFRD